MQILRSRSRFYLLIKKKRYPDVSDFGVDRGRAIEISFFVLGLTVNLLSALTSTIPLKQVLAVRRDSIMNNKHP